MPSAKIEVRRSWPPTQVQAIVGNPGALGIAPNDNGIVLHEVPLDNRGIRGGVPASEVDLGFKIDV